MVAIKLSNFQKMIFTELQKGGKILVFDFPIEYAFEDSKDNSISLRKDTFDVLSKNNFIEIVGHPNINCSHYSLSRAGKIFLKEIEKPIVKNTTNHIKVEAIYIGPKDFTGFEPKTKYTLQISYNQFTRQSIVYAPIEDLRAKYSSLNAFLLNFDKISIIPNTNEKKSRNKRKNIQ